MSKMGSHDSFGHFKHMLWPKERSGVKLAVWFPTTKSQESTWLPCVQVACDIPLESSQRGLQFCLKPHLNWRSAHKVMGPQMGVPGQNVIWMWASWRGTEYTIMGKVVTSPKSGLWWVLLVWICLWLVLTPKVLKLCTNQFVVWFVQVHVNNWCLSLFLVPIPELQHAPLPLKCYKLRSMPQLLALPLFSP
jgi:hypothetical protein